MSSDGTVGNGLSFLSFQADEGVINEKLIKNKKTHLNQRILNQVSLRYSYNTMRPRRLELPREILPLAPQASASAIPP